MKNQLLAHSYLVRCLSSEIVRAFGAIDDDDEVGSHWKDLLNQCLSKNKHTLREVHHQINNMKMTTTESLVSYFGRLQGQIQKLENTTYAIPDQHLWGIMTMGLRKVYKQIVWIINLNLTDSTYQKMVSSLQELARENVGDPNIPLELQRRTTTITSAALETTNRTKGNPRKFKGRCYWRQNVGHVKADCHARKKCEKRVPKEELPKTKEANIATE